MFNQWSYLILNLYNNIQSVELLVANELLHADSTNSIPKKKYIYIIVYLFSLHKVKKNN